MGVRAWKILQMRKSLALHGALAMIARFAGGPWIEKKALQWSKLDHVRSRYGVLLESNWTDVTFNLCYFGSYGRSLANILSKQDRPFVFLNIGANQGLYSLIAAKNLRCLKVLAFEPVPSTFLRLCRNIHLNGAEDIIQPVNKAIAQESGHGCIRMCPAHSGAASMSATNDAQGDELSIELIDHCEMDELIPAGDEPIVVKIDVEGFEETVVDELVASVHLNRMSAIFYEIDEKWTNPARIEMKLRAQGFSRFQRIQVFKLKTHYDVYATRPLLEATHSSQINKMMPAPARPAL